MVKAEDILADILAGKPVKYGIEDGPINGNLNLDQLKDDEGRVHIPVPIEITNLAIGPGVNFGNAIFEEAVCFKGSTFGKSNIDFSGACFRKDADFSETKLGAPNFSKAEFCFNANFVKAKFVGGDIIDFTDARFKGNAKFSRAKLGDQNTRTVVFEGAKFEVNSDFSWAQFSCDAIFNDALFIGNTSFYKARFSNEARFVSAKFSSNVYFSSAKFSGNAIFILAQFICNARFTSTKFDSNGYFSSAKFNGGAKFSNAQFGYDAIFTDTLFDKELDFCKLKFSQLYISWTSIKDNLVYDGPTYLALIKNFKIIERFVDADDSYYQYRKVSQDRKRLNDEENCWDSSKLLDIASWISCGYGVRPIHTIICMLCIVVIGGFMFLASSESLFESFYFSVMTFTGGDPDNLTLGRWLRTVAMIEAILGYLFMALFVVVLGRKFIR
ncbi:MAG TPA: ion channel [Methanothrix sp.]|nr:ion channel [Methanothrix sp.]